MAIRSRLTGMVLMLWLTQAGAGSGLHHDQVQVLREAGTIVPLDTILADYRQRYRQGRILETELEFEHGRYVYEIEFLDSDGVVRELEYDAESGTLRAYELYITDPDGTVREVEYDAVTGQPVDQD